MCLTEEGSHNIIIQCEIRRNSLHQCPGVCWFISTSFILPTVLATLEIAPTIVTITINVKTPWWYSFVFLRIRCVNNTMAHMTIAHILYWIWYFIQSISLSLSQVCSGYGTIVIASFHNPKNSILPYFIILNIIKKVNLQKVKSLNQCHLDNS